MTIDNVSTLVLSIYYGGRGRRDRFVARRFQTDGPGRPSVRACTWRRAGVVDRVGPLAAGRRRAAELRCVFFSTANERRFFGLPERAAQTDRVKHTPHRH